MNDKQKINCTVGSCKFNNCQKKICELEQIVVSPTINCNSKDCDESMCSSYVYNK